MNGYFTHMKNILPVTFQNYSEKYRYLFALILISLIFIPTQSFSGELYLCSSDGSKGGVSLNSKGQAEASIGNCKDNPYAFVLTDTENSGLTSVHVIGQKDGKLNIKAKKGVDFHNDVRLQNNGISQLKAGALSEKSKDAVNGSQLFSTNQDVSKNADNILKNKKSIKDNQEKLSADIEKTNNNIQRTAVELQVELQGYTDYKSSAAENNANNYTNKMISQTKNDIDNALNNVNSSLTENKNSITELTNNINDGTIGLVRQSKTDGSITVAAETNGESVSVNGTQGPRFIRDVKAGVSSNDAVNVSQLNKLLSDNQILVAPTSGKEQVQATKQGGLAFGGGAKSTAEGAIAIGDGSKAVGERGIALGQQANSSGSNSIALGSGATAPAENAVALGANSVSDRNNGVSVGSPGYERQITNVAPGTQDTDAANIAQLNQVRSTATSAHGLAQKNTSRINNLENQLSQTNKKIDIGLAASAALTGLFQPYGVGSVNFTAGIGGYGSSHAIAIGSGYRVNEHAAVKAGLAYSGGSNAMYNVSFNLEW